MPQLHRGALAVALAMLVPAMPAFARHSDPTGFEPARASALTGVPVHIILLNDHLRSQWTYGGLGVVENALVQNSIANSLNSVPGGYTMGGAAAGALGGAIAMAMIEAQMRNDATRAVAPADDLMTARECKLDMGSSLADAVARAVAATDWGRATTPARAVLGERQSVKDMVRGIPEREEIVVGYSMSPDYSMLQTTLLVTSHAAALKAADARRDDPAWSDEIVITSDPVSIAAKTPQDAEALVAAENARYAASDASKLIKAANSGNNEARREAVKMIDEHKRLLREAQEPDWRPWQIAARRAELWSADGCAMIKATAAQQAQEAESLLGRLFRGELPTRINESASDAAQTIPGDARDVLSRPVGLFVLGRGGTAPGIGYRYAWLPEPKKRK